MKTIAILDSRDVSKALLDFLRARNHDVEPLCLKGTTPPKDDPLLKTGCDALPGECATIFHVVLAALAYADEHNADGIALPACYGELTGNQMTVLVQMGDNVIPGKSLRVMVPFWDRGEDAVCAEFGLAKPKVDEKKKNNSKGLVPEVIPDAPAAPVKETAAETP